MPKKLTRIDLEKVRYVSMVDFMKRIDEIEGIDDKRGGVRHVIQSDEQIDIRKTLFGFLWVALDKAACNDDHAA